jgi:hypothetical protein
MGLNIEMRTITKKPWKPRSVHRGYLVSPGAFDLLNSNPEVSGRPPVHLSRKVLVQLIQK